MVLNNAQDIRVILSVMIIQTRGSNSKLFTNFSQIECKSRRMDTGCDAVPVEAISQQSV